MKIILDEKAVAEEILNTGKIYENIYITIKLLIKYWYIEEGLRKKRITEKLNEFLEENYQGYNQAKYENSIEKEINSYIRKKYPFVKIESVNITKNELSYIHDLENITLEKVAFSLLVYCKVMNQINPNNNNRINGDLKELFKDARVVGSNEKKYTYIHKIQEYGGIHSTKKIKKQSIRVDFIDEESETEIAINDFREFILEYLKWRGEDIIECEVCEKRIIKVNNKVKYCDECAEGIKKELDRERMKNIRNSRK